MNINHKPSIIFKWLTGNKIAANILMLTLLLGGYFSIQNIKKEVFPEIFNDSISISVSYPGSSPLEIENGILKSIESEVRGIDGIKRITSQAVEGSGTVIAELIDFVDQQQVLQDIKNSVDRIKTFPLNAEEPKVKLQTFKRVAISLVVYGKQNISYLRKYAESIKNELIESSGITLAEIASPRPIEVSVEITESKLRELNLTLPEIGRKIKNFAIEVPGGGIKTSGGEILVRIDERREGGIEFADTPILASVDGSILKLSDIASINDGFTDNDQESYFENLPAVSINVYSVGSESPVDIAKNVKEYIQSHNNTNGGIKLSILEDRAELFKDRIDLLTKNAVMGLILVLIILGLFLDIKLAFWVMMGLPISILGSFIFMQLTGASINMVSLFAFIITLGIVVDDAIIVGESVYQKRKAGLSYFDAAVHGVTEMFMPVTFAVLTNLIVFVPLLFVPGASGDIFFQIPAVVISVLFVSLIESLFILPSHLAHSSDNSKFFEVLNRPQRVFREKFNNFNEGLFKDIIYKIVEYRYTTLAVSLGLLIVSVGLVNSGLIKFSFLPRVERDNVSAEAQLPYGVPITSARKVLEQLVDSANVALGPSGSSYSKGIYASIGENSSGSHNVNVLVSLVSSDKRKLATSDFVSRWREASGDIVGLQSLTFTGRIGVGGGGAPIQIEVTHPEVELQEEIAKEVAQMLKEYDGVIDINDGIELGKIQLNLTLTPLAKSIGISSFDISEQIRSSFYGFEAIRQQRGENEMKVMVKLSESERTSFTTIENMTIKTVEHGYVPLTDLAYVEQKRSYTKINRTQGKRVIAVKADVDNAKANLNEIIFDLKTNLLPGLKEKYPQMNYSFEGEEQARNESLDFLKIAFILALVAIYVLLAIPLNSYFQPIVIMLSIPFGIVGALGGHLFLGYDISIISIIGIIGLSGIVINDSLVFVVTLNRYRHFEKYDAFKAATSSAIRRLRPILLTSLTTFFGLTPILFEPSMQARFLVPMAISIGFGVLFATFITLSLVPSLYLILEDVKAIFSKEKNT